MQDDCRIDVESTHIEYMEKKIDELAKHSIDWRFFFVALVPVAVTVGGSLISIAIQVNTMSERVNNLNLTIQTYSTTNRRDLDMIHQRLDHLENRGKNATE